MIRLLAVLILLAAACKPKPSPTTTEPTEATASRTAAQQEPGTTPVDVPPSDKPMVMNTKLSDELKLACARTIIDVEGTSEPKSLDAEQLATEGAFAEAFARNGAVVRITGGKLFESQRLAFDYIYRDGKLMCAAETRSSLNVMLEDEEGWEFWWHQQHAVFNKGGGMMSLSEDFTTRGEGRGSNKDTLLADASELHAIATK